MLSFSRTGVIREVVTLPPWNQMSVLSAMVNSAWVSVPPYSGAVNTLPLVGSVTYRLSAAAAGSSFAAAAQRPVAVITRTNATAKVILFFSKFMRNSGS